MFIKNFSFFCKDNYYKTDKEKEKLLIENGFIPIGRDKKYTYFVKTNKLKDFLKERGEKV